MVTILMRLFTKIPLEMNFRSSDSKMTIYSKRCIEFSSTMYSNFVMCACVCHDGTAFT